ncbi:CHY zinc finger-containing protein [Spironucleus salmonicida]|uniref:CHY zinc finger-containing protein n=1 Tax=Spironucleus salmonicida TaxID=348837 RepID=A0A9P8LZI7_9EUKA|nr:CHY zinc finger-containing protein [Spironucleus salmonicida]
MNNYKNHVIFQRIFKLKPNTRNINNEANRIYIKQYKYQVLNNDRKKQQLMDMDIIFDHLPISGYKFDLTDYENIEIFRNTANYTMNKLAPSEKLYSIQYLDSLTGCQHYVRGCEIECVTCKKFYICRFCHNDNEDHNLPRFETEHFRCIFCKFVQLPTQTCTNCNIQFGSYFCAKCKLVCDIGPEPKPNYHCDTCGCCMVGLQQYSKHCDTCGMCYSTKGFVSHKCRSDIGECIVCLDQLKHSIFGHIELKCGHLIHSHCHDELLYHMDYKCPICKKFTPQGEERRVVLREQRKLYKRVFFGRIADQQLVSATTAG